MIMNEIYVSGTTTLYGNRNGEVVIETNEGDVITFYAGELYKDLPSLVAMTHIELDHEEQHQRKTWLQLGKKLVRDYKRTYTKRREDESEADSSD